MTKEKRNEVYFDQQLKKTIEETRIDEEAELCGIRLRVPKANMQQLRNYEDFIRMETPMRKLQYLKRTLLNTRQIRKTLDIRKFADIKKRELALWKEKPNRIIAKKINLQRLKNRVARKLELTTRGEKKKTHECPVYMCGCKFTTEEELVMHYNSEHADLVNLGLRLEMSKTKRRDLRQRRREQQANSMIMDGIDDPNLSQTDSDASFEDEGAGLRQEGDDPMITAAERRIGAGNDSRGCDVYGYRKQTSINPAECDSDLEDLLELEKIELARKHKPSSSDPMRKKMMNDRAYRRG
jgi:hypothetical protein